MQHILKIVLILMLALLSRVLPLRAEHREPLFFSQIEAEDLQGRQQEENGERPGLIDTTHGKVSESILSTARWIDSFFSDERAIREETETRLRLGISNFTQEGDLFEVNLRTRFRLDLPVFKDNLRLLLAGEEEERDRILSLPERIPRRPAVTPRERDTSISLRYYLLSTLRQNASISTGIRFRNGSPHLLVEPRYRQTFPIQDWNLRFTQRFTLYTDDRYEIHTSFDLERLLQETLFFRTTAAGAWVDHTDNYYYGLHFALFQPLGPDRIIQFLWANNFITSPSHGLEESIFSVSYRQRAWREWLFLEVTPQVSFPRGQDYQFSPGLLLGLEIVFGEFRSFTAEEL